MKAYELFIEEDGYTWLTGEIIKTQDSIIPGDTKWIVNWEAGSFIFYGGKHQLKAILRKLTPNFVIGKEVTA